ncbi:unnamed protein product [Lymnaea stagnalis]|uniref:MD-2-related lipid-recognition domain-containing protein n=1 Tax=Lymnaea stagnalis TaxID=6523 RepID=A0AAV2I8R2_LYMST
MESFVWFVTLLALASAEKIAFKPCPGDNLGQATSVELSPCPSQPCTFSHGSTVTVVIEFTAVNDSTVLDSRVYGIVETVPVEFPLPNGDGCKDSGIACPLVKGQSYKYTSSFPVLNTYPVISLVVMWKLQAISGNLVCFTFPLSITRSSDTSVVG